MLPKLADVTIDIYSHVLQRVLQKRDEQVGIVKKIFKWVVCARRPMNIDELKDAFKPTTGHKSWKKPLQKLSPSTVSKLCGDLVKLDDIDGTLWLAYHTV